MRARPEPQLELFASSASPPEGRAFSDLRPGHRFAGTSVCIEASIAKTRRGTHYLTLLLDDGQHRIRAHSFTHVGRRAVAVYARDRVRVEGTAVAFGPAVELRLTAIEVVTST